MLRENKSESRILFQPCYVSILSLKKKKKAKTLTDTQRAIQRLWKKRRSTSLIKTNLKKKKTNLEGSTAVKEAKVSKYINKTH